jgi:hypothetical protein
MELKNFIELVQEKHGHRFSGHKLFCEFSSNFTRKSSSTGKLNLFASSWEDRIDFPNLKSMTCISSRNIIVGLEEKTSGRRFSFLHISHNNISKGLAMYGKTYKHIRKYMFRSIIEELKNINEPIEVYGLYDTKTKSDSYFKIRINGIEKTILDLNSFAKNNSNFEVIEAYELNEIELITKNLIKTIHKTDLSIFNRKRK